MSGTWVPILSMAKTSKNTFQISCQSQTRLRTMLDLAHNYLVGIQTIPKQTCKQNPGHLEIFKVKQSTLFYQPKKQPIIYGEASNTHTINKGGGGQRAQRGYQVSIIVETAFHKGPHMHFARTNKFQNS